MIKIIDIGDMHTGSKFGLNPLQYVPDAYMTPFSEWVYSQWESFCKENNNPDILILGGDLVDGIQQKQNGTGCITTDLDEQVSMCTQLLKMLVGKNTKTYGVNGSGYHSGIANSPDRRIIEALGGEFKYNTFSLNVGNEIIQISHGARGTINNPFNLIKTEMEFALRNAQKRRTLPPTILSRHHLHVSCYIKNDCGMQGYVNPCWQYSSDFITQRIVNVTPNIGSTIIEIEENKPTKIYTIEYLIPEEIHDMMNGIVEVELEELERQKEVNYEIWKSEMMDKVV